MLKSNILQRYEKKLIQQGNIGVLYVLNKVKFVCC